MAGADYFKCSICNCKLFYDANVDWESFAPSINQIVGMCNNCAKEGLKFVAIKKSDLIKYKNIIKIQDISQMNFKEILEKEGLI